MATSLIMCSKMALMWMLRGVLLKVEYGNGI